MYPSADYEHAVWKNGQGPKKADRVCNGLYVNGREERQCQRVLGENDVLKLGFESRRMKEADHQLMVVCLLATLFSSSRDSLEKRYSQLSSSGRPAFRGPADAQHACNEAPALARRSNLDSNDLISLRLSTADLVVFMKKVQLSEGNACVVERTTEPCLSILLESHLPSVSPPARSF